MFHAAVKKEEAMDKADAIRHHYEALKEKEPGIRARNAAEAIGVSEAELVAAFTGYRNTRLSIGALEEILPAVKECGYVMALTRNEACVHERKGVYDNISFSRHGKMYMGLAVNPDIDLRLFLNHWAHAFAVSEGDDEKPRKSLQFFDKAGEAVHKIYLTPKSDAAAFHALVTRFTDPDQSDILTAEAYEPAAPDLDDGAIDWAAFRTAWENLKDTHDFFPMLRKFKAGRQQAFRRIGNDFAWRVAPNALRRTLEMARDRNCEIMVFAGNKGCLQIHTGPVKNLVAHGPWYNVLDPVFNLHLREDMIDEAWVTRKPTDDGIVTAVELFDKDGGIIATLFGKRKPGIPELTLWREIAADLRRLEA